MRQKKYQSTKNRLKKHLSFFSLQGPNLLIRDFKITQAFTMRIWLKKRWILFPNFRKKRLRSSEKHWTSQKVISRRTVETRRNWQKGRGKCWLSSTTGWQTRRGKMSWVKLRKRPKETSETSNLTEVTTTATETITMRGAALMITTATETIIMMIGGALMATTSEIVTTIGAALMAITATETITMIGTSSMRARGEATFQRVGWERSLRRWSSRRCQTSRESSTWKTRKRIYTGISRSIGIIWCMRLRRGLRPGKIASDRQNSKWLAYYQVIDKIASDWKVNDLRFYIKRSKRLWSEQNKV